MITEQVYVFLWSIFIGIILTVIFDLFRLFRRNKKSKDIIVYIQDVLFWIIVAIIIMFSAFITNNGELRGYMIIGYVLGSMLYLLTISNFLLNFFGNLLDKIEKILRKISDNIKRLFNKKKNNNIEQDF